MVKVGEFTGMENLWDWIGGDWRNEILNWCWFWGGLGLERFFFLGIERRMLMEVLKRGK
jgi:hypothetical protein